MAGARPTTPPSSGCPAAASWRAATSSSGCFPNAGNPRKVQRYAAEWAAALRHMERLEPEIVIPGHGPVIFGRDRAAQVLGDGAAVLEHLVREFLALMNRGATLDQVLHEVTAPAEYLSKPYLRPNTMIRSSWSGPSTTCTPGWFDGNPAHLKPARAADLALELARLAGGANRLAERAAVLAEEGNTRLAAHLAEFASEAAPDDKSVQAARALVLLTCIDREDLADGQGFPGRLSA